MTGLPEGLEFEHCTAAEARSRRQMVEDIYRRSYVDAIASEDPFDSPSEFMRRFDSYTDPRNSGFAYLCARVDGQPAGQIWGWPLPPNARWWTGLHLDSGDIEEFTTEDGTRTFGLSEIMVCAEYARQGIAHALHDELLCSRTEQRATLLVEADNERAYERYRRWGWNRVGWLRPSWPDAPQFDVLMRELPGDPG
ncbi:GNAT family N-acetyltransferase [Nocardia amamiensis]|uniref:GNAT family N-acetyltransferase n=1 Tax=Nocardia amamiensis TaxID=404578 RepID=A0ABS0CZF4_9NOCA|nr:GNAT family N-acetyltransferase [Nocardia amamiensis]MBF6301956.1 GNAT family N-acetyltransferase [Nocardia amamiensis]